MKNIIILFSKIHLFILICMVLASCRSNPVDENEKNNSNIKIIKIEGDIKKFVPNETFFENITPIPLETNDSCLIEKVRKTVIVNNYVFIQNASNSILLFDLEGNFLRQIGRQGKGPSEYSYVKDFCIDKQLNIHIASDRAIYIFTIDNMFIRKIPINISYKRFELIPEQIVCMDDLGYLFWKTYHYVNDNNDNVPHHLIRIDQKQRITQKYLPLSYTVGIRSNIFHKYKKIYNMDPPYGLYTIYSISNNGVQARYYLDFGKRSLDISKYKWKNYTEFREYYGNQDVVTRIYDFVETDNWIYFGFIYRKYKHNAFYNKKLNKVYAYEPKPDHPPHSSIIMSIDGEWEGNMFSVIEPIYILEKLEMLENPKYNNHKTKHQKNLLQQLSTVSVTDNPIIFLCELRN